MKPAKSEGVDRDGGVEGVEVGCGGLLVLELLGLPPGLEMMR